MKFSCVLSVFVFLLVACGHDMQTPVKPVKEAEHFVTMPDKAIKDGVAQGVNYCNRQTIVEPVQMDSQGNDQDHAFGQGGGCVHRTLLTAWAASRAREAFHWDRSNLDDVQTASDPNLAFQFLTKISAGPAFFVQRWTMQWDHTLLEGTPSAPKRILIHYQKIQGTSYIRYWQGAVTLEEVAPGVVSVRMRNEIDADQTGVNEAVGSVRDFIGKLRTL